MTFDSKRRAAAADSPEALDAAFAKVLAAERAAEESVLACHAEAEALLLAADEEALRLAERAAERRRRRGLRRAQALALELAELQGEAELAAGSVALDEGARRRLAAAVERLADELCGGGSG